MPDEYERIWLRSRNEPFSLSEPTFYARKINDHLIEYVRADILASRVAPPAAKQLGESCFCGTQSQEHGFGPRCIRWVAPPADAAERAREIVRQWADSFSTVSWQDLDCLMIFHLPRELDATDLIDRIAAALSQVAAEIAEKDAEIKHLHHTLNTKQSVLARCQTALAVLEAARTADKLSPSPERVVDPPDQNPG